MGLARRRAERVKDLLAARGVEPRRIVTTTRGAQDAVGGYAGYTDAIDRRVDLEILP